MAALAGSRVTLILAPEHNFRLSPGPGAGFRRRVTMTGPSAPVFAGAGRGPGGGGGCGSDDPARRPRLPRASPRPRCRCCSPWARARARSTPWSPGPATSRTARPTPEVDWVTPFEQATGCQVNVKVAATSDEMVQLMKSGQYDAVSASGDASLRLIAAGDVAPVNTSLVRNYRTCSRRSRKRLELGQRPGLRHPPRPRGQPAHVADRRRQAGARFLECGVRPQLALQGQGHRLRLPIYIADAAPLYLKATKPELGITNPYELDDKQFQASVDLLKQQAELVNGEYWSDYTKEIQALKSGSTVLGTTWQVIANLAQADKAPVEVTLPKEGSTGWSDTWMVSSKAANPNCAYLWMNHIISPKANAQVAEWFGEAPANKLSC